LLGHFFGVAHALQFFRILAFSAGRQSYCFGLTGAGNYFTVFAGVKLAFFKATHFFANAVSSSVNRHGLLGSVSFDKIGDKVQHKLSSGVGFDLFVRSQVLFEHQPESQDSISVGFKGAQDNSE